MAWTTPKTWNTLDPLVAGEFNTQFRDNLNALRDQTNDAETKLGQVYPTWQNPKLFHAVIGVTSADNADRILSSTYQVLHSKCKLTFMPQTDEVLFGVQIWVSRINTAGGSFALGLQKGSMQVSWQHTAVTSGAVGSTQDLAAIVFGGSGAHLISYQAPVSVSRNVEVTISPTAKRLSQDGGMRLYNPSVAILTALDVGTYE